MIECRLMLSRVRTDGDSDMEEPGGVVSNACRTNAPASPLVPSASIVAAQRAERAAAIKKAEATAAAVAAAAAADDFDEEESDFDEDVSLGDSGLDGIGTDDSSYSGSEIDDEDLSGDDTLHPGSAGGREPL